MTAGETRLYKMLTYTSRSTGIAGVGILVVDLLSMGGAMTTLTLLGSCATAVGGGKELYDVFHVANRTAEKRWIAERRHDVDRYLDRLADS